MRDTKKLDQKILRILVPAILENAFLTLSDMIFLDIKRICDWYNGDFCQSLWCWKKKRGSQLLFSGFVYRISSCSCCCRFDLGISSTAVINDEF